MLDLLEFIAKIFAGNDAKMPDGETMDYGPDCGDSDDYDSGNADADDNDNDSGDADTDDMCDVADQTDSSAASGSQSVRSMLANGITTDSVSDDEYEEIVGKNDKSKPAFTGNATPGGCNLCSCKQYDGEIGMGKRCSCGHTMEQHVWI